MNFRWNDDKIDFLSLSSYGGIKMDVQVSTTQEPMISSKRKRRLEASLNGGFQEFRNTRKTVITTTRFNQATWEENVRYREKHPALGCIYPTPVENNTQLAHDTILFVLEMNNDTNRIEGIGLVRNRVFIQKYMVYSNPNYNRYAYLGKYRIDRSEMTKEEDQIMRVFDILCFTGARHLKRLQGIKQFPDDMLYGMLKNATFDMNAFIATMFKRRNTQNSV